MYIQYITNIPCWQLTSCTNPRGTHFFPAIPLKRIWISYFRKVYVFDLFFAMKLLHAPPWVFSHAGFYRQAPPVALSSDPPQPGRNSEPPQAVRKVWGKGGFRSKVRFFFNLGIPKRQETLAIL